MADMMFHRLHQMLTGISYCASQQRNGAFAQTLKGATCCFFNR